MTTEFKKGDRVRRIAVSHPSGPMKEGTEWTVEGPNDFPGWMHVEGFDKPVLARFFELVHALETKMENYTVTRPEGFHVGDVVTGVDGSSVQVDREVPVEPRVKPGTFGTAMVRTRGGVTSHERVKGFVGKRGEFHYYDEQDEKSPHTYDYKDFEEDIQTGRVVRAEDAEYAQQALQRRVDALAGDLAQARIDRDKARGRVGALMIDVRTARDSRDAAQEETEEVKDTFEGLARRLEDTKALAGAVQGNNRLGGLLATLPGHCVSVDPTLAAARVLAYLKGES